MHVNLLITARLQIPNVDSIIRVSLTITIHDIDLSDHAIVEAELVETDKEDTGPGIWRLNNTVLQSNYEFIQSFLNHEVVSRKNYDDMNST